MWAGLVVKEMISILGVQILIPTNDMGCVVIDYLFRLNELW
jgi:hypothetical protein